MEDKNRLGQNMSFEELAQRYISTPEEKVRSVVEKNTDDNIAPPVDSPRFIKRAADSSASQSREKTLSAPVERTNRANTRDMYVPRSSKEQMSVAKRRLNNIHNDLKGSDTTNKRISNFVPDIDEPFDQQTPGTAKKQKKNKMPFKFQKPSMKKNNNSETNADSHGSSNKKGKINLSSIELTKNNLIFVIAVLCLSIGLSVYAVFCVNDLLALNKSSDVQVVQINNEGMTANQVIDVLHDYKLIRCPLFCKTFVGLRNTVDEIQTDRSNKKNGTNKEPRYTIGTPYTPGTFELTADMGLEKMLVTLKGDVAKKETVWITFPEGFTLPQIIKRLSDNGVCEASVLEEQFNKQMELDSTKFDAILKRYSNENVPYALEGYMFPERYEFYKNDTPENVVNKFLSTFKTVVTDDYYKKAEELGYTMDEIIIIASIIQKEAANEEQMDIISAVIHNRLKNQNKYPMLECDSTSDYITKQIAPNMTVNATHDATYYNKYYNTYVRKGLPEGPICNPGLAAIKAALNPSKKHSKTFFFLHDSEGNIHTAQTFEEHNANKVKYLK